MNETTRNSMQYTVVAMILTKLLLLLQYFKCSESANNITDRPWCPEYCGNIAIPYPFGIGQNCSRSEKFSVTCQNFNKNTSTPYLGGLAIQSISANLSQARIRSPVSGQCYNNTTKKMDSWTWAIDLHNTPFWLNIPENRFAVFGCNTIAYLHLDDLGTDYSRGCLSSCDSLPSLNPYGFCSGTGCCQTAIPKETSMFKVSFDERYNNSVVYDFNPCSYAMVVEYGQFNFSRNYLTTNILNDTTQQWVMVVDWAIEKTTCDIAQNKSSYACRSDNSECLNSPGGYICQCSRGYHGQPYIEGGCQDIDECHHGYGYQHPCSPPAKCHNIGGGYRCLCPFGWHNINPKDFHIHCQLNAVLIIGMTIALTLGAGLILLVLYFVIAKHRKLFEKRKQEKLKQKFFVQNRGLLLEQLIASNEDATQNMRILGLHELEKATNGFDNALIIGRGGHGEVYKGILSDQRVVAIKRSKIVDPVEIEQFINEVVILSQVNHRNVVNLYGCCLETEVPLLVYEFISNGTLFNHLHVEGHCSLTWKHRLRIAREAAGAISYLHSSASIAVFHRDIKSANILLDDYFTTKVSDFGASRSVQIDQTGVTTVVQGTYGYVDPEYYHTGRLTEKSDVYSFGVILAELLIREKTISEKFGGGSLVGYLNSAMKENRLFEILDPQVVNEGHRTELKEVANLAGLCLKMKGVERPTMKKVENKLNDLWRSNQQQEALTSQSLEERQLIQLNYPAGIDTTMQHSSEQEPQSSSTFFSIN